MDTISKLPSQAGQLLYARRVFAWGQISKGLVYSLVGLLALASAIGIVKVIEGPSGLMRLLSHFWPGRVLAVLLAIGLAAYVYWRFYRAWVDPAHEGLAPLSLSMRIGYALSGSSYLLVVILGLRAAILGPQDSGQGNSLSKQSLVSTIVQLPWGQAILISASVAIAAVAIYQMTKAWRLIYLQTLDWKDISDTKIIWAGRLGLIARGLIFTGIAWYAFKAGYFRQASAFRSTEQVLEGLSAGAKQESGSDAISGLLLAMLGLGLLLYGYFCYLKGRYAELPAFYKEQPD